MINNSLGPIILIVLLSIILIVIFWLFKKNIHFLSNSIKKNKSLVKNIYIIEIIIGVISLTIFAGYLFRHSTVMFSVLFVLLLFVVFFLGIFFLKDYIAGLIIKASSNYEIDDILVFEQYEGKVIKLSKRFVIILNTKGDKIFIPFSKMVAGIKYIKGAKDTINTDNIILKCKTTEDSSKLIKNISDYIVSLPWINHTITPNIVISSSNNEITELNITIYSLDHKYIQKIEASINGAFGVD